NQPLEAIGCIFRALKRLNAEWEEPEQAALAQWADSQAGGAQIQGDEQLQWEGEGEDVNQGNERRGRSLGSGMPLHHSNSVLSEPLAGHSSQPTAFENREKLDTA